jgi:hypothetical protein
MNIAWWHRFSARTSTGDSTSPASTSGSTPALTKDNTHSVPDQPAHFRRAAPIANKGSLTQYVGRILRSHENKTTAEVHDYLDERTGVLAAMLAKRAPGYAGLGFPNPRRLALTPSASTDS